VVPTKKKEGVMTTEELETVALTPEQIAHLAFVVGEWNQNTEEKKLEYLELGWLLNNARKVVVAARRGWHPEISVVYDNPVPGNRADHGGSP
jgi:hypothetical protein